MLENNKDQNKIFITRPLLPEIKDYILQLKDIWASRWITNNGQKHNELEAKLTKFLKVRNLTLFNNGTIALLTALKALDLPFGSEVITTPFTFAATPHSIVWSGCRPVFCDIEPETFNIDADKIENLITKNTSAILAVHVFGFPCNVEKLDKISKKYCLKLIYDAAHSFACEINGQGIGNFGDISMFSFHATKLFNTIEGGCLTYNDDNLKEKLNLLRNFGIKSEEEICEIGINGKMNEFQAAMGLENLKIFDKEVEKRKKLKEFYNLNLSGVKGIKIPKISANIRDSYQYYPIIIQDDYFLTRDELYNKLKNKNILTRKYFYPLCTDYDCYKNYKNIQDLPIANDIKNRILCLPFYGDLDINVAKQICEVIENG